MKLADMKLLISCEHASNAIPKDFFSLFINADEVLASHRGWDIGSVSLFNALKKLTACHFSIAANWSRLLIDLNRSLGHSAVFSEFTNTLTAEQKHELIRLYYLPYRHDVMEAAESLSKDGVPIVHLSIHSFTEKLNNQHRLNDIGFLYDPKRPFEKAISSQLKQELCSINPELKVRMNYPYLGTSDGLTNSLRKLFPDKLYAGIEIEMNQKHFTSNGTCKNNLADEIASAVENCFKHLVTR